MSANLVSLSKFLSLVLRHKPGEIGLSLDANGWAGIDELIRRANAHGTPLTRALVEEIVTTSDKKRFVISEDGQSIRANQGHSIAVDLGLIPREPPAVLYHGTATRFVESIQAQGIQKQRRQHVHLSRDKDTAVKVGARHGQVVVLQVDAGAMHREGHLFFLSDNGVWLTEQVPPAYLEIGS